MTRLQKLDVEMSDCGGKCDRGVVQCADEDIRVRRFATLPRNTCQEGKSGASVKRPCEQDSRGDSNRNVATHSLPCPPCNTNDWTRGGCKLALLPVNILPSAVATLATELGLPETVRRFGASDTSKGLRRCLLRIYGQLD